MKLYEPFKKWKDGGVIWIFSDPHFGDSDCKLMDKRWISPEEQVDRINSKVGKKDTLIIIFNKKNIIFAITNSNNCERRTQLNIHLFR